MKLFDHYAHKLFVLLSVAGIVLVALWGVKIYDTLRGPNNYPRELSVEAEQIAYVTPDVATVNLGVYTEGEDSADVIARSRDILNSVVEAVNELGIEEDDIETANYNLNPKFNYSEDRGSYQSGFTLNQSVLVKIRDFALIGDVLGAAGESGATNIGNVQFIVEDRDAALEDARMEAIAKAKVKAKMIEDATGIQLGKLRNYYEYKDGGTPAYSERAVYSDTGLGGGGANYTQPADQKVRLHVNLTYRIK